MRKSLDRFYGVCVTIAAICMVAILVTVTAQILGRLVGVIVPSAPEIAGFSMAGSSFMALAYTLRNGGHIRVSLLIINLGARARIVVECLALFMALGITIFFTTYIVRLVMESIHYGDVSSGILAIPLYIPQSFLAFGLFALAVALADSLVSALRGSMPAHAINEQHAEYSATDHAAAPASDGQKAGMEVARGT